MVDERYFEHTTPDGVTMVDRISRRRLRPRGRRAGRWARTSPGAPAPRHRRAASAGLDGVARAPRQHPAPLLPRDRDRHRARRAAVTAGRPARHTRRTSGVAPLASAPPWPTIEPLRALHYDLDRVGGLQPVVAPPYDVIDAAQRAALLRRSPHNVVEIDLPAGRRRPLRARRRSCSSSGSARARSSATPSRRCGRSSRTTPAPDGRRRTRHGFFARVRVEDYGPGRIRPHERTHPGPKEDRLRLTRATRANLSPIFSLYDDPGGAAWGALAPHLDGRAVGRGHRRRRHRPPALARHRPATRIAAVQRGAGAGRAADRRRPPPLRDRPRVRRGVGGEGGHRTC